MTRPASPASPAHPAYPPARRMDLVEYLSGHQVADPYRWLEDPTSQESQTWLSQQDELVRRYLADLPLRPAFAARLRELTGTGLVSAPQWRGDRCFFLRRAPGQEHAALITSVPGEDERVLIDPMAVDPSGATTLDAWTPDHEGRLLAYQLSHGGDEESLLRVLEVATGAMVEGPIDRCRYSEVAWLPGGVGYYYTRRLAPQVLPEGEAQYHRRVYLHMVGASPAKDTLIFGEGRDKTDYYGVWVSRDGRWLVITAAQGTSPRTDVWLADLAASSPAAPVLRTVQAGVDARTSVEVGRDGRLYVFTDSGAPRGRLAVADPGRPERSHWRDLLPEDPEAVLAEYAILDDGPGVLVARWTRHAISQLTVHDLGTGERRGVITGHSGQADPLGTIGQLSERPEGGHELWYAYTDHTTPTAIYRYDARSGAVRLWARSPGSVAIPQVSARMITYSSRDAALVRMIVVSPLSADDGAPSAARPAPAAARPAILTGYGGFAITPLAPAFSPAALAWVEAGGVYAIAGLRGGDEEGEGWHRAGMREHKQRVFDDFHAAAATLIGEGWTTVGQLAISGGSNGGLLVGAALTQQPDRYAAVVCSAPLLDMARYELFGLGQTWNDEFGIAADPTELGWLLSYSPYHHVREGVRYPAVLFTIFDSDTRVDPMHARKMCAALQHATITRLPSRPILLRRESQVGHGARAVSRSVALSADTLAFLAAHTGLGPPVQVSR